MPVELISLNIPPEPSAMVMVDKSGLVTQPWQQWFDNVRNKTNVIGGFLIQWAGINPISGVTAGTYGDATHYPVVTVNQYGQVTNITLEASGGGVGGVLPVVTGEIASGQPVFVYLDDGSLVYAEVA